MGGIFIIQYYYLPLSICCDLGGKGGGGGGRPQGASVRVAEGILTPCNTIIFLHQYAVDLGGGGGGGGQGRP